MKTRRTLGVMALLAVATVLTIGNEAAAIIGRPLTAMSYAGVARRTVRRTAYVGAAVAGAATVGAAAALPAGCAPGVVCGGVVYQPAYAGTQVVYVH